MIGIISIVVCVLVVVCNTYPLYRYKKVDRFLGALLDTFKPGDTDFKDRLKEFDKVPVDQMRNSFKSVESFYEGTEILRRYRNARLPH